MARKRKNVYSGIGGQAVLEGVMMKNKKQYSVAVRKPDGEIDIQVFDDNGFKNPTKPVGPYYTVEQKDEYIKTTGATFKEDVKRGGWRKVVASPKPKDIYNLNAIEKLVADGSIVVACGGGGIPVFDDYKNKKVEAVIDKDLASSLLAEKLHADKFIILTAVDQVCINFGTPKEKAISYITTKKAIEYRKSGEFKKGSMLPKIDAAIRFVNRTGNDAIITSLSNIKGILNNTNITTIRK